MAKFETAYLFTFDNEGGYQDGKNDYGGETKYGISRRWFPNEDIKNLTPERAKHLLKIEFWDRLRLQELNYQTLANHVFDMSVNAGGKDGVNYLQLACVFCGKEVKIDGIIGPKTLAAANSVAGAWITDRYRVERVKHYLRQITIDKNQLSKIQSWLRRATA